MKLDNSRVFGTEDLDEVQSQFEDMCHGVHRIRIPEDFDVTEEEYACGKLYYGLIDIEAMSDIEFLEWLKVRDDVMSYKK